MAGAAAYIQSRLPHVAITPDDAFARRDRYGIQRARAAGFRSGRAIRSARTSSRISERGYGAFNVTQTDPAGAADPNRLDTANGLTPADISVSGTVSFNQTPCVIP